VSIHLSIGETELVISHLEKAEKEIDAVRQFFLGRFEFKKPSSDSDEGPNDGHNGRSIREGSDKGPFIADMDVSQIQFKQKAGAIAGPYAKWGWAFALTQEGDYHEETRELVQAIEQYEKVQVGNRIYTLGGRDGNLLNFKELDEKKGARADDGSS
jgi:hypothetical protein